MKIGTLLAGSNSVNGQLSTRLFHVTECADNNIHAVCVVDPAVTVDLSFRAIGRTFYEAQKVSCGNKAGPDKWHVDVWGVTHIPGSDAGAS